MVDARAERKNSPEIRIGRQKARRRFPHAGVGDLFRIEVLGPYRERTMWHSCAELRNPRRSVPSGDGKKESVRHVYCATTPSPAGLQIERGRKQRARIGILRPRENFAGNALFHDLAVAHHDQAACERRDDLQVMRNEHVCEIFAVLQIAQKIDDLRLDQHVERGRRLVEHDKSRLQHDGACNRDALALSAGKFVRITEARLRVEPDLRQRACHAFLPLRF